VSAGRAVNRVLSPLGLSLQRRGGLPRASAERALRRLPGLGVQPRIVVDVGAAYGDWSALAGRVFPEARFLLVEPLSEFAPFLEARARDLRSATVVAAAAGRTAGTTTLHVHEDLVGTSLRSEPGLEGTDRTVQMLTIDELVSDERADGPFAVKLDVQGAELDVLAGAAATLAETELVQLEALFFPFYDDAPEFADVVAFMRGAGFVVYDIVDPGYRPLDGALAQADVLFVPDGSPLRRHHEYASQEQRHDRDASLRALFDQRRGELER
jgi:FkbM family methyltransferase